MKIKAPFAVEVTKDFYIDGKRHLVWLLYPFCATFYRAAKPLMLLAKQVQS